MENKGNIFKKILAEYKLVTWASKKTVFQTTVIVLLIALLVSIYIMGFDFLVSSFVRGLTSLVSNILV